MSSQPLSAVMFAATQTHGPPHGLILVGLAIVAVGFLIFKAIGKVIAGRRSSDNAVDDDFAARIARDPAAPTDPGAEK